MTQWPIGLRFFIALPGRAPRHIAASTHCGQGDVIGRALREQAGYQLAHSVEIALSSNVGQTRPRLVGGSRTMAVAGWIARM